MNKDDENLLREYFTYRDGALYWVKLPKYAKYKLGDAVLGTTDNKGFRLLELLKKHYMMSHVVFYLHHNYLPDFVYHLDGNKSNIAIENLKEAKFSCFFFGCDKREGNFTSKYKGVSFAKDRNKWRATITKDRKRFHIGYFDNEYESALAYDKKALSLFGEYAKTNF